jgi:ABC-type multidrug transport system fused ATPase/permease subunit
MVVVERPRTTPGSVFIINSATTIVELLILTVLPSAVPNGWPQAIAWIAGVFLPLLSVILMLNMPMRDPLLDSSNISRPFTQPSPDVRSPEDAVTLWQWMTVSWMAPLMKVGYERQLHDEDVWLLPYDFHHSRLHSLFREVSGTVFTRLLKANGLDLVITTSLAVLETSIELVGPILLKQLLAALTAEQPNVRAAIVYAGITLVSRLVQAQSGVFSLWFQRRAYERSRGELITMIHEKTLRRKAFTFPSDQEAPEGAAEQEQGSGSKTTSGSATLADDGSGNEVDADPDSLRSRFQQFKSMVSFSYSKPNPPKPEPIPASPSPEQTPASTGKILNLLRNDAYEIAQRFWESPNIVTKPLSFLVSLVLVWRILGPASLSGILVLLTCMAINALLMRLMLHIEQVRREITDNKLQRTSQFVESIRHLRWYDWQDAWLSKIMESRKDELIRRVQSNVVLKGISAVNNLGAYLFPVAGFWAYTLVEGRPLTVDVAFPALNLFTMLQDSLRELPNLVTVLLNAKVSMDRIEAFMLEPEKEGLDRDLAFGEGEGPPGELEIIFRNASFSWPGSAKEVLRDVSIACRPGLTLVCGKVGIGKTALLQAILGELDQHGGERIVPSEAIGYCAQTPWLESMSIRENILFSAVYDKARFEKVIDACCLRDDLDQFRAKDLTLIGENGVGLSGGQRARVALARAIYSQARVLLLDDPIAALDHHTATSILANFFSDKNSPLTAGRLIIFVTHRVDIVTPYAYQVIEIVDGGRAETFDRKELENNEEELEHLAEIANTAPPPPDTEEDEPVADKFIEEERRVHGGVLASVYWQYIKAGRLGWWSFMIGGFILFRTVRIAYFWFLKEWGEQYQDPPSGIYSLHAGMGDYAETSQHVVISQSIFHISGASSNGTWLDLGRYLPAPDKDVRPWLVWFLVLSVSQVLASALSDAALVVVMYQAGKNLFAQAMSRVTNATFRFYDVTPVGRLMNRLTSDMGTVDGQIAGQLTTVAWYTIGWLSAVAVISSATPLFLVISVTMTALFVLTFNWFLPTSQSLRRLETVSLSPLMSNFGTLVEGLTTVRAYRAEPHFQNRIIATTDAFQKMDHFYWSLQAWLQYRFDILSALTTFILTLCAILTGLSSGTVGFVLASAANFVRSTHSLCRKYGELQMQFVSVERIVELLSLEQEPRGGFLPPAAWPGYGDDIVFDNVTLRYAPQLETVLHNVSFTIPGGANVAVTGRTASGKSTVALALLGTLHPDPDTGGSIRIGAVDLLDVDKHTLRRNITFVAQDPVLFPGTLRDNLDPLGERDETERAEVLERVLGRSGSFTLDSRVDGGGKNLSQGQRQLVGLGRAMLRRSPVVIMDEATASIDAETAAYIQRLLREELRYSTVITIAHKAEAVEDADWEVVLDKGRVVRAGPRGRRRA